MNWDFPKPPLRLPAISVIATSTLVGAFFGLLAAMGYAFNERPAPGWAVLWPVGTAVGAMSGAAVGVFWSRWMARKTTQLADEGGLSPWALLPHAVGGGGLAGATSTLLLHAALTTIILVFQAPDAGVGIIWLIGLFIGVPAGLLVGLIGGVVWYVVVRQAARVAPDA